METITLARRAESLGHVVDAARYYDEYFSEGCGDHSTYIDAAFVMFAALDPGFASHHSLTKDFVEFADQKIDQYLESAKAKPGGSMEAEFWQDYFQLILIGENSPGFDRRCEEALERGVIEACVYLSRKNGADMADQVTACLSRYRGVETEKARYIISILDKGELK